MSLKLGLLPVTYGADLLGKNGSHCPCLLPLPSCLSSEAVMLSQVFGNGDGIILLTHDGRTYPLRLLLTQSQHYLLPVDRPRETEAEHQALALVAHDVFKKMMHNLEAWFRDASSSTFIAGEQQPASALPQSTISAVSDPAEWDQSEAVNKPHQPAAGTSHLSRPSWDGHHYCGDEFAPDLSDDHLAYLKDFYKHVPEEYYSQLHVPVVTPSNFETFIAASEHHGQQWHLQERGMCCGRLSLAAHRSGLIFGFPAD